MTRTHPQIFMRLCSMLGAVVLALGCTLGGKLATADENVWSLLPNSALAPFLPTAAVDGVPYCSALRNCYVPGQGNGILNTWEGASFDPDAHKLRLTQHGGHGDLDANDYEFSFLTGWRQSKRRDLSGPVVNGCATEPDGTPNGTHTYDGELGIGLNRSVVFGGAQYCIGGSQPLPTAVWLVDHSGPSNVYTAQPHLAEFQTYGITATFGPNAYFINKNKRMAIIDRTTLAIVGQKLVFGVPTVGEGALAINSAGDGCLVEDTTVKCFKADGTIASFAAMSSFPIRAGAPVGSIEAGIPVSTKCGVDAHPDNRFFVYCGGDGRVWAFRWEANNTLTWQLYAIPAGSLKPNDQTVARIFGNFHWVPEVQGFVTITDVNQGVMVFHPDNLAPPPPPPNQAPIAVDDACALDEDTGCSGDVAANDSDPDGDTLLFSLLTQATKGAANVNPDGTFTYTPNANENGTDTFRYVVGDGEATANGTVTLTIAPVDEPTPAPNKLTCEVEYEGALPDTFTMNCERTAEVAPPPPPPPPPPVTAAPDTGPWGPDPDASLASLMLRTDTLLADPLDDTTPISGPGWDNTTELRTIAQATAATYSQGPERWVWDQPGIITRRPVVDPTIGDGGALKFFIDSQSGAGGAGLYTVNLSHDRSIYIEQGQSVRVRVKVRWSCDVLFVDCDPQSPVYKQERRRYAVTSGTGGIKFFSIAEADTPTKFFDGGAGIKTPVCGNFKQFGYAACYIAGLNFNVTNKGPLVSGIQTFDNQPGGPTTCWQNDMDLTPDPFPGVPKGFGLPFPMHDAGCHMMQADQWVTIQMDLHYDGPCQTTPATGGALNNNRMQVWMADEGQPFELVIDDDVPFGCSSVGSGHIGKVWLTPYNTSKDPTEVHPTGYVWYDSLWVQRL